MRILVAILLVGSLPTAASAAETGWAHVGNTDNSAIFVDRAVLAVGGPARRFRSLHINARPGDWRSSERRGLIDCAAKTVIYEDFIITKSDGRRETHKSTIAKPAPFPPRGILLRVATAICSNRLGPAVLDPAAWTARNFKRG